VEQHNFSIRKRLLDYDDVMNKQREVIYDWRRSLLLQEDSQETTQELIEDVIDEILGSRTDESQASEYWDWAGLSLDMSTIFLVPLPVAEDERASIGLELLRTSMLEKAIEAYDAKVERLGADIARQLEQHVTLRTIDDMWKDHLHELDILRGGISLRAYGQKDPLLEYKSESFGLFQEMMGSIRRESVARFFRYELVQTPPEAQAALAGGSEQKAEVNAYDQARAQSGGAAAKPQASAIGVGSGGGGAPPVVRDQPKVGRNDPCPCGSGKKYKKCHGQTG